MALIISSWALLSVFLVRLHRFNHATFMQVSPTNNLDLKGSGETYEKVFGLRARKCLPSAAFMPNLTPDPHALNLKTLLPKP